MDKLTNIVRDEISRQYKSVRQFAFAVGIPLSTINSALHNGIGGSSFDTVVQICRTLGICALGEENIHLTEDTQRILDQYAKLDDYGRHTIARWSMTAAPRRLRMAPTCGAAIPASICLPPLPTTSPFP